MKSFDLQLLKRYKITQVNGDDGKRHYILPNGKKYPSVTTYLKSMNGTAIDDWKARVGPEVAYATSQRASKRGTMVHNAMENYIKGKATYLDEVILPYKEMVNSLSAFLDNRVDTIYGIELPLYSTKLRAAGTSDLLCVMDGVNTMADFKTSEKPKKEAWITNYFYQVTTYALMVYELYGIEVPQIAVLIATEDDGLQVFKKPTKDFISPVIDFFLQHELYPKG